MKIYTKTGDTGVTSLLGGTKVSKADIRLEAYGTVDELNSAVGLLISDLVDETEITFLTEVQKQLFELGSELAVDPDHPPGFSFDTIAEKDIEALESRIDAYTEDLPELKNFVLPGGSSSASHAHLCRTICRRAERRSVALHAQSPVRAQVVVYLNRLSDYFFVLARYILHQQGGEEVIWTSRRTK